MGAVAWLSAPCRGTHERFAMGRGNQVHLIWPTYMALTPTLDPYTCTDWPAPLVVPSPPQWRSGRRVGIQRRRGMPIYGMGLCLTTRTSHAGTVYNGTSRAAHATLPRISPRPSVVAIHHRLVAPLHTLCGHLDCCDSTRSPIYRAAPRSPCPTRIAPAWGHVCIYFPPRSDQRMNPRDCRSQVTSIEACSIGL